jgi:glucosamine--fructose-6-phosphate aminotransferase (isomerizing)
MVREADGFLLTHAKQEVSVASTKSFSSQVAVLYWLSHYIAVHKGLRDERAISEAENDLLLVAEVLENAIEKYRVKISQELAPYYMQFTHFIFLGRDISYPFAREAALKLKELAYIFVDCYPAGELKHGAIALIDRNTPTVLFSHPDPTIYNKILSGAQEVKARRGHLVVFAFEGQDHLITLADTAFVLPKVKPLLGPLAMTGLMQFFIYEIAYALQRPIDKPRNLAKSVTVE